jgi:MFS family permease
VVQYWHVLLLATALGLISAVDTPIRQSFVVEMVGRDDLTNAVAINSTIFNAGRVLGPAIAGVTISAVGSSWAFLANGASSIAVLSALAMMRPGELFPAPQLARARGQLREGFRYVRRRTDLLLTMALVFVIGTFGLNFQLTTALMAKQVFHRTATGFGLLSTALAVGACLGAVLATRRIKRPSLLFLVLTAITFAVLEISTGLMPSFVLTALFLVPTGTAMLTFTTAANSSVQLGVDPTMRGRVMALYLLCFMGGTPFGAPLVGWVAETLGPRWGLLGGGLICLVAAVLLAGWVARRRGLTPADVLDRLVDRDTDRDADEVLVSC